MRHLLKYYKVDTWSGVPNLYKSESKLGIRTVWVMNEQNQWEKLNWTEYPLSKFSDENEITENKMFIEILSLPDPNPSPKQNSAAKAIQEDIDKEIIKRMIQVVKNHKK